MKIMKMTLMVSSVNKINMARNRIAVHPFGYKKIKEAKKEFGHQIGDVQNITMNLPYKVPIRDENGKLQYKYEKGENGKKHKVLVTETFLNTFHKVVYHNINNKPKKGRSLADMVYESYKA